MKQQLRISVRDLVEFLERSGDLDSRSGRGGDAKIMRQEAVCTGRFRDGWEVVTMRKSLKIPERVERFSLLSREEPMGSGRKKPLPRLTRSRVLSGK